MACLTVSGPVHRHFAHAVPGMLDFRQFEDLFVGFTDVRVSAGIHVSAQNVDPSQLGNDAWSAAVSESEARASRSVESVSVDDPMRAPLSERT